MSTTEVDLPDWLRAPEQRIPPPAFAPRIVSESPVPPELAVLPIWLNYRLEPDPNNPETKPRKVPYYVSGGRRNGTQGSSTDRVQLVSASTARASGIPLGITFHEDSEYCGIDLDHCRDPQTGVIEPWAWAIIEGANTYTEISPSRTGAHIIGRGRCGNDKATELGIELFSTKGFLTWTESAIEGYGTIREIPCDLLAELQARIDAYKGRSGANKGNGQDHAHALDLARLSEDWKHLPEALKFIDPDCLYPDWIAVGMGIHWAGFHLARIDEGFKLWNFWSAEGKKYPTEQDLLTQWQRFRADHANPVTPGTLFALAAKGGWRPDAPDASGGFGAVGSTSVPGQAPRSREKWESMVEALTVTQEHVQAIEEAEPLWLKLVWHGKYHVWCAPPNAGKTTIAVEAAGAIAASGFEVLYFNLDAGASDLKHYHKHAQTHGYRLLAPMQDGTNDADAVQIIDAMMLADDLSGVVLILDTLKKFADLMNKRVAATFFSKVRSLTRRGCTVIALAHTTKYKSDSGELIPDGVGDLKADADMLMLLYHVKDEATGDLTVSTRFDKQRAMVEEATFRYCRATRTVTVESEYRDTQHEALLRAKETSDWTLIECIKGRLPANQSQLVAAVHAELRAGRRSVERVLRTYTGRHWNSERSVACNERLFTAVL